MIERRIYKWALRSFELSDVVELPIHRGARILSVGNQDEQLCVWAIVDPREDTVPRFLRIAGTGHPIDDKECNPDSYVGRCDLANGRLIFHVFDLGELT